MTKGASLSDDGRFRYLLWRVWDESLPMLGFVMLNPSTADAMKDDPTIEFCCRFADEHDYGGIMVANLSALRTSHPDDVVRAIQCCLPDPTDILHSVQSGLDAFGIENGRFLQSLVDQCHTVMVGWGNNASRPEFAAAKLQAVAALGRADRVLCFGLTSQGEPMHPAFFVRTGKKPMTERWHFGGR